MYLQKISCVTYINDFNHTVSAAVKRIHSLFGCTLSNVLVIIALSLVPNVRRKFENAIS